MKKSILLISTVISASAFAEDIEHKTDNEVTTPTFKMYDNIESEIDLWSKKGSLQSAKKNALTEELENIQLEKAIDAAMGKAKIKTQTENEISVNAVLDSEVDGIKSRKQNSKEQEQILMSSGEPLAGESLKLESLERDVKKLQDDQGKFFQKVESFLNTQAMQAKTEQSEPKKQTYVDGSDDYEGDEEGLEPDEIEDDFDGDFSYQQTNLVFTARLTKATPKQVEIVLRAMNTMTGLEEYTTIKFSPTESKTYIDLKHSRVLAEIIKIEPTKVSLMIEGNHILAM